LINHKLDYNQLHEFSRSLPYDQNLGVSLDLIDQCYSLAVSLNFPIIEKDVGSFINFILRLTKPKVLFEMGSGFGGSCLWYCNLQSVDRIILTEKRLDLQSHFEDLNFETNFRKKIDYIIGDSYDALESTDAPIDYLLIDGQKSSYLDFLKFAKGKLSQGAIVVIDNSFWRGAFLDTRINSKSAVAIRELHEYLSTDKDFKSIFLPFDDGVSIIQKY
jgi:predicted O-methyltransferase YrrM